jgi:hypothetical protein
MNLAALLTLHLSSVVGTWYRAIHPRFLPGALSWKHTALYPSRYYEGPGGASPVHILYLADSPTVALFEVEALFGTPTVPGAVVPGVARPWAVVNVAVNLTHVADLTDEIGTHLPLSTTAQEMTGDWRGYTLRSPSTAVKNPTGVAPTQSLGPALYNLPDCEGFRAISAKMPYQEVLGVFPPKLKPGNSLTYQSTDASGIPATYSIP